MLCSLFRFMISGAADSGKRLDWLTSRHIPRCASCRRFHRSCRTLAEGLRSQAAALSPASRLLTRQILAGLPHAQRRQPAKLLWPAMAAAACITMTALITFTNPPGDSPVSPVPSPYSIAAPAIELTGTWARVFETPLLTEARNLSSDAQSGIRFLVACLAIDPSGAGVAAQIEQSGPPPVQ